MPPSLTTEQLNRVEEVLDGATGEEDGLQFVIDAIQERRDQNILDDSIYRKFINYYRQQILDGLDTQKAFLDGAAPLIAPHRIKTGTDWPPSGGDAVSNDLNDWAIWKGPNGTISASIFIAVPAGLDPAGTFITLNPSIPNGAAVADEILMTSGPAAGTTFPIIGLSTIANPPANRPIVAGNESATGTGNIVAGLNYVIMNPGGTVAKISAGNAAIVYRRDPPVNFNPTAEPDATIDNAVVSGNPFFFMRFDDKVGTEPQLANKTSQKNFLEDFLENTEGKNMAYASEFGT